MLSILRLSPRDSPSPNHLPSEHIPEIQAVFFSSPATTLSLCQPSAAPDQMSLFNILSRILMVKLIFVIFVRLIYTKFTSYITILHLFMKCCSFYAVGLPLTVAGIIFSCSSKSVGYTNRYGVIILAIIIVTVVGRVLLHLGRKSLYINVPSASLRVLSLPIPILLENVSCLEDLKSNLLHTFKIIYIYIIYEKLAIYIFV